MSTGGGPFTRAAERADAASSRDPSDVVQPCPYAKTHWVEIEMVGEDDQGIADEPYCVVLPDQTVRMGRLDARGRARIEGIAAGVCRVSFPRLDTEAWSTTTAGGSRAGP